ncbi:hypothetical protein PMAYCL1PPCAC_19797 [Pristionchus mayeri]|uniref:G protein-coupled receptor n=1 Tax=Pristionchus mayeri TaxID=1317129 RepID=A0AAN5I2I8_9BILA|nr:hypothetical protein PMAYCL1PPCAC_19797 [Pristionchus mayeri]
MTIILLITFVIQSFTFICSKKQDCQWIFNVRSLRACFLVNCPNVIVLVTFFRFICRGNLPSESLERVQNFSGRHVHLFHVISFSAEDSREESSRNAEFSFGLLRIAVIDFK